MRLNLKLSDKALILVAVPLIFELIFVCTLAFLLREAESEARRQAQSKALIAGIDLLAKYCQDAGMSTYLYTSTQSEAVLERYQNNVTQVREQLKALKELSQAKPEQQKSIEEAGRVANEAVNLMDGVMDRAQKNDFDQHSKGMWQLRLRIIGLSSKLLRLVRQVSEEEETAKKNSPWSEERSRTEIWTILVAAVVLNVILAIALALFFNRGTTRRLSVLMDNTSRMARGEQLNPALGGKDEIAHLDTVFHDMARSLRQSERIKQEFVSMISHDLRTPLMSVQADLCLLSEGVAGELGAVASKCVGDAERNISYVITLINSLLDIERMTSGRLELHKGETTIGTVVERSAQAVRSLAERRHIKLNLSETDTMLVADEDRLVQVMINLMGNAIKFSPEESEIAVKIQASEDSVLVKVVDQGRGVPKELQSTIFNRYEQVQSSDATLGGAGLGLAICKAIIDEHGGEIGVESQDGSGSTFWFKLPLSVVAAAT